MVSIGVQNRGRNYTHEIPGEVIIIKMKRAKPLVYNDLARLPLRVIWRG